MTEWENPFDLMTTLFESRINDTLSDHPDKVSLWNKTIEIFWHLSHSIDFTPESFVGRKIFEWQRNTLWAMTAVYGSAYDIAIRELRFLIEDAVQSVYIESRMADTSLEAKVKVLPILEDSEKRGRKMIDLLKGCEIHGDIRGALKRALQRSVSLCSPK